MIKFRESAGVVVAADVQASVASMDEALLNGARMCVSVLEAFRGAGVPIAQSQKVIQSMTSGIASVVAGRADMTTAVRHLTLLQSRSNLAVESYGCPDGWSDLVMPTQGVALGSVSA